MDKEFLTVYEAATFLRVKPTTLSVQRSNKKGPDFYKIGNRIYYKLCDLKNYVEQGKVNLNRKD